MTSRVLVLLASLFLVMGAVERASACDCSPGLVSDAFEQSEIVFAGRVAEISRESLEPTRFGNTAVPSVRLWAKFIVEERFKGIDGNAVVLSGGNENSNCSSRFVVGASYLVFASRSQEDGRLVTSICTPTLSVEQSAANLAYCRHRVRTGTEPRLIGRVSEQTSPFVISDATVENVVGGIAVTLEGEGRKFGTTTDATGVFLFDDTPNGEYTLSFALPEGWRMLMFGTSTQDGYSESIENRIRIDGRTVVTKSIVTSSGDIVGRILDSNGHPLKDITLNAIPKERAGKMQPNEQFPMSFSGANGEFGFGVLLEGEYLLLVNWSDTPPDIGRPPFPFYWYASPSSPDCTAVFTVKKGRVINLGDVKAPPTPEHVVIDVTLVNGKGELEMGTIECRRESGEFIGYAGFDGESAKTQVFLPTGSKYLLTAESAINPGEPSAEPLLVDPAKPPHEIKLVVGKPAVQ